MIKLRLPIIYPSLLTLIVIFLSTGCSSTGSKDDSSATAGAAVSEDAHIQTVMNKMDDMGYDFNQIGNPVIDEIGALSATQFKRQKVLMESYNKILKTNKDVASFLYVNKDKTQEDLKAEIMRFDSEVSNNNEKIGAKLSQFENATTEIHQQNLQLAKQLAATGLKIAALKDNGLDKLVTASGFQAVSQLNKVKSAFNEITERWSVGEEANKIINTDKERLNNLKEMQKLVSAKSH